MTTKFPQLPVLGHVPKKRKENLDKVLTLREIYEIIDAPWLNEQLISAEDGQFDYVLGLLRDVFKAKAKKP